MAESISNEHKRRYIPTSFLQEIKTLCDALRIEDPQFKGVTSFSAVWVLEEGTLEASLTVKEGSVHCVTRLYKDGEFVDQDQFVVNGIETWVCDVA